MIDVRGLEVPEQLGALFIGDAGFLVDLARTSPPLVDDFPRRITSAATPRPEDVPRGLYRRLMDAGAARERFAASAFVARLWPATLRERSIARTVAGEIRARREPRTGDAAFWAFMNDRFGLALPASPLPSAAPGVVPPRPVDRRPGRLAGVGG